MRTLFIRVVFIALFVALYHAIKASVEPETWNNFWNFMFGDFVYLWNEHFSEMMPSITNPVVMIIIAIFAFAFITARLR